MICMNRHPDTNEYYKAKAADRAAAKADAKVCRCDHRGICAGCAS